MHVKRDVTYILYLNCKFRGTSEIFWGSSHWPKWGAIYLCIHTGLWDAPGVWGVFPLAVSGHRHSDNTDFCWHYFSNGGYGSSICLSLTFHHLRAHQSVWREQPHGRDLASPSQAWTNELDYNASSAGLVWRMNRLWTLHTRLSYKSQMLQ